MSSPIISRSISRLPLIKLSIISWWICVKFKPCCSKSKPNCSISYFRRLLIKVFEVFEASVPDISHNCTASMYKLLKFSSCERSSVTSARNVFIKLTAEEKLMLTDCSISDSDWVLPLCSVDNNDWHYWQNIINMLHDERANEKGIGKNAAGDNEKWRKAPTHHLSYRSATA